MIVTLPWPYKGLSPNDRMKFMAEARAVKAYRKDCAWLAIEAGARKAFLNSLAMKVTFSPPRAGFDKDNCIAAFKAGQDGLADAIGAYDRLFGVTHEMAEPVKGGRVAVELDDA